MFCLAAMICGRADAQPGQDITVMAPATPASIPIILATDHLPGMKVRIFHDHSQAHSLFLSSRAQIISTGISVGIQFFRQHVPVKMINAYVTGLSFLVTNRPVKGFRDLKGQKIWLPFPGSPLEEVTRFFVESEGLVWKHDIFVGYTMSATSVKLLQQKRIDAAALPEPFVSLAGNDPGLFVSLDYAKLWEQYTRSPGTCPQVGTFVNAEWAKEHPVLVNRFNLAIKSAIDRCIRDPVFAVQQAQTYLAFPESILRAALSRTRFHLQTGRELQESVFAYYKTIGTPLDETVTDLF
jgi:NitT/TauT family transport system substrate-binding protein